MQIPFSVRYKADRISQSESYTGPWRGFYGANDVQGVS